MDLLKRAICWKKSSRRLESGEPPWLSASLGTHSSSPSRFFSINRGSAARRFYPLDNFPSDRSGKPEKVAAKQAYELTLEISPDAAIGEYQLRIRSQDNLSELVTFWVTPFDVIAEKHAYVDEISQDASKRNDRPEFAQPIPLNSTVYGYVANYATQDHDWFSVECQKGQRLSVEVCAARLGFLHYGGMNDPAISIHDATGKRLARNDDNAFHNQDPVLSIIVPRDGKYLIHMRQQMDYENRLRHYLLHVGTFARPTLTYPLGGPPKQRLKLEWLGDASGNRQREIQLGVHERPYEGQLAELFLQPKDSPIPPSPNRFHVSGHSNVFESNQLDEDTPQKIDTALPFAINGRIEKEGEVDWYLFRAQKGDRYRVRTYAKTLASELDAKIFIRPGPDNPSQKNWEKDDTLWEAHDWVGHPYRWQIKDRMDPIFMFEPDVTGDWLIGVADTRRESGSDHIYRVDFQPHVDSTFVHFPAYPSLSTIVRDRIVLYRGKSFTRPLAIQKGLGSTYTKPLQLRAIGLPAGVHFSAPTFTQNDATIPIWFSADSNAELVGKTFEWVVEPVAPEDRANFRGGFVQVLPATNRRGDYAMYFDKTRLAAIAVCESVPFDISIGKPSVPLLKDGLIDLEIQVDRKPGFAGAIYCEMDWLPRGLNKQPPLIIPADKTSGRYTLRASGSVKPGVYKLSITARENEGGNPRTGAGFHYIASPPVELMVEEPIVKIDLARTAIERQKQGHITARIRYFKKFEGEATLELDRLPFGVKQLRPFPKIKHGTDSVQIKVEVTRDCLTGLYKDICCNVTIDNIDSRNDSNQPIRQQTGSGVLRVDEERK